MLINIITALGTFIIGYCWGASRRECEMRKLRWENDGLARMLMARAARANDDNIKVGGSQ